MHEEEGHGGGKGPVSEEDIRKSRHMLAMTHDSVTDAAKKYETAAKATERMAVPVCIERMGANTDTHEAMIAASDDYRLASEWEEEAYQRYKERRAAMKAARNPFVKVVRFFRMAAAEGHWGECERNLMRAAQQIRGESIMDGYKRMFQQAEDKRKALDDAKDLLKKRRRGHIKNITSHAELLTRARREGGLDTAREQIGEWRKLSEMMTEVAELPEMDADEALELRRKSESMAKDLAEDIRSMRGEKLSKGPGGSGSAGNEPSPPSAGGPGDGTAFVPRKLWSHGGPR